MATIYGDNYSEDIDGTSYGDTIYGKGGDDWIRGFGGSDLIYGGTGDDLLDGGSGSDDLIGNSGVNDYYGGSGLDWFIMSDRGNASSDDWIGDLEFDDDTIDVSAWGISDFSQLLAVTRTDSYGDAWLNAYYNGYDHYLTIDGVRESELVASDFNFSDSGPLNFTATDFDDVLFGSSFDDSLIGAGGSDELLGGYGEDALRGGGGSDALTGGRDDDVLFGNAGRDLLTGNQGFDRFVYNAVGDLLAGSGRDRITDFQLDVDTIVLSSIDADTTKAGNQAFEWRGQGGFTDAGQLRYAYIDGDTLVSGNTDNDLAADFQIMLTGHLSLAPGDFVL